jgi:hypothetical protein
MKVMINKCNHGFTLSQRQLALFPGTPLSEIDRADSRLIQSFEDGDQRGDGGSTLRIVEIPDNAAYAITEKNGVETLYWSESNIHQL